MFIDSMQVPPPPHGMITRDGKCRVGELLNYGAHSMPTITLLIRALLEIKQFPFFISPTLKVDLP